MGWELGWGIGWGWGGLRGRPAAPNDNPPSLLLLLLQRRRHQMVGIRHKQGAGSAAVGLLLGLFLLPHPWPFFAALLCLSGLAGPSQWRQPKKGQMSSIHQQKGTK